MVPFLAVLIIVITNVDNNSYDIFNRDLEKKIIYLTKSVSDYTLVVAGDSRAEGQVVPAIIENRFNIKTINIATSSCDVVTMYNALRKYGLLEKPITIIVSASFFQVNDGAVDTGYISMAELVNMPVVVKLNLLKNNLTELRRMYIDAFMGNMSHKFKRIQGGLDKNDPRLNDLGFHPVSGSLKLPIEWKIDPETTTHNWYKNINIHGARWKVLQDTLKKMSESKCRFIVYQPPVSDSFKAHVKGSSIDTFEQEYSSMLKNESTKYNNLFFLDYYSTPPPLLTNDDYYDPQHLNRTGAEKFTAFMINDCIRKSLIIPNL
jgi:hypothetical protein